MVKSICQEHHIEMVTWNDPFLQSNSSQFEGISHISSFLTFIEGSMKYTEFNTDSIRDCCRRIVMIDLLPTSLLSDNNTIEIQRFQTLVKEITQDSSRSTLVLWIVDTVDEKKGISGIRNLLPTPLPPFFLLQVNPISESKYEYLETLTIQSFEGITTLVSRNL